MLKALRYSKFLVQYSILFFLISCGSKQAPRQITPAFYHWKSTFQVSQSERQVLEKLQVQTIFTRFFDVDWNGNKAVPISVLEMPISRKGDVQITPVVYITNRTFQQIEGEEVYSLAGKTTKKIMAMYAQVEAGTPKEVQFDCDWSESTKGKYFVFLRQVKKLLPEAISLSATIRLHQIKYFQKTGTPPVDRGTLMFYNMSSVRDTTTVNSILDLNIAKKYLYQFENYPLDLDVALPVFGWGAQFRAGQLLDLISPLYEGNLLGNSHFRKVDDRHYEVLKSTYLNGKYIYEGDQIRLEKAAEDDLIESVQLLKNEIRNRDFKLLFYHLDSLSLQNYPYESLENLLHLMR